ncbi:MAG TPA: glycosyltransferase [Ignavibacteriaceae bacterium]|nr:glycosyltransferase [Ignavibacteriaceae bacterium]
MNENPLVSVNILSYNRKDELRNTLQKVFEQDYKNIEVIVVDNASNDGSDDMVKQEYPDAQLIQLKKNIGIA